MRISSRLVLKILTMMVSLDEVDLDDDNDGIYDIYEGDDTAVSTDGDGIPDYLDLDS